MDNCKRNRYDVCDDLYQYTQLVLCVVQCVEAMNSRNKTALNRYLNRIDKGEEVQEDGEFDSRYVQVLYVMMSVSIFIPVYYLSFGNTTHAHAPPFMTRHTSSCNNKSPSLSYTVPCF